MQPSAIKRWFKRFEQLPETLSPANMGEYRVLAWTVQAVIISKKFTVKNHGKRKAYSGLFHSDSREGKIIVYRSYFIRLLTAPKPLRDQLMLELPALQAFRTGEVSSFRVEYVDFERGDLQVLDSKKYRLFTVPLDLTVAQHLQEYIRQKGFKEGICFLPEQKGGRKRKPGSKTKGVGLSLSAIQRVWEKWCQICGVPVMSPRMGRAYFACKWHFVDHKNLFDLMAILRHDDILATQKYLSKIHSYEDLKAEFYRGTKSPFSSLCFRSDSCPLATEGCYCRMFQPKIEVTQP